MAAAILSSKINTSILDSFHMASSPRAKAPPPSAASSSRPQPSSSQLSSSTTSEAHPKTFKRLRSSFEQSLRTATKSKAKSHIPDETGTISQSQGKGKEKAQEEHVLKEKEKTKSKMLSKVPFRRGGGQNTVSPSPVSAPITAIAYAKEQDRVHEAREAGFTSFLTPSLRQASMSSPTLHTPYSQPFAIPNTSSSNIAALISPPRARKPIVKEISGPTALAPRRDPRAHEHSPAIASTSRELAHEQRARARAASPTAPPPLPSSSTRQSQDRPPRAVVSPDVPSSRTREATRSPQPASSPRGQVGTSARRPSASSGHLPLANNSESPATPRAGSPNRAQSSSRPSAQRNLPSSPSHLPPNSPSASASQARRPSVDGRRPSAEVRRPSVDARRPSVEATRRPSAEHRSLDPSHSTPSPSRTTSPTPVRSRTISPTQRNYSPVYQGRYANPSTTSIATANPDYNPEHRELIRMASTLLCREMLKPSQLSKSSLTPEWEEVEVRMRALARLERVWGKSGSGMASTSQVSTAGGLTSSGLSAGGEEREKRLFCEALRDGYVLCQLMNHLRPGSVSRADRREDGFVRTTNVTKFLAACSSAGLSSDDLFNRDDLIEATSESLARVAKCIIALANLIESPPDRSKFMPSKASNSPYGYGANSRGAASTPNLNLAHLQRSTSPAVPTTPSRKRLSPPQTLPTVRSDSPNEGSLGSLSDGKTGKDDSDDLTDTPFASQRKQDKVPPIISLPPRSPLRTRASVDRTSVADSMQASMGDSVRGSFVESLVPSVMRQSVASSNVTEASASASAYSSLLEVRQSSNGGNNKFGTIRTVTTEATSFAPSDAPSFTRTEASFVAASFADEAARKRATDPTARTSRERRPSETALADLSRVVEETEESGSSSKGGRTSKSGKSEQAKAQKPPPVPIKLGKGKWPDDFLDAFQSSRNESVWDEIDASPPAHTPLSISPPRKLAVVRPNESIDTLPQFPRRPTHRARHSVDTPGLLPKDSLLRRDSSPDTGLSPSPRIVLRRSSTKTGHNNRNGIYIPRDSDSPRHSSDSNSLVPFPHSLSPENSTPSSQERPAAGPDISNAQASASSANDRPRQFRGRFQSEVDGASSRRKARPNSYDEHGAKPRRSRFESMVNLGVASNAASDLMARDLEMRRTLIVKEDGKPSTQFQLGNCIGRGQFGAVYRALNLNTGQTVAVKRINLEGLKEEEIAQLMKEVDLVKSLSHPSIVKYEGMARDEDTLSIVLEFAENGSLGQTLKAFGKLNERLVASYVVKILEGLHYLHQSDVVHCDLKAANILTTKNGNVKLSDFGVSLNLRAMGRSETKDVAGTPNWMAPEVIELRGASPKSDIWSLACTIIELLTGRPPYAEIANTMSVMFHIVEEGAPPIPEGCSEPLQDFLKLCFNKDPEKRPSAELLFEHEWLKKNWAAHKELRPQDSIPFLRRVSTDLQKSDVFRYLSNIEMPDSERMTPDNRIRADDLISGSPPHRRLSNEADAISPREHTFVKTTFGKPVICRVCLESVKKSAVLCSQCSLIAHAKCAANAPPTCDLRSQLLLYAQYAESGTTSPITANGNSVDNTPTSPSSATSDAGFSPRQSVDTPPPHVQIQMSPHPPTAFKVLAAFKRSRSSLTNGNNDNDNSSASSPPSNLRQVSRKHSILKRNTSSRERPLSISSTSTPNSSSMRSAATAAESFSSRPETDQRSGRLTTEIDSRSRRSASEISDLRLSKMTSLSVVSAAATERDESRPHAIRGETSRDQRRDQGKSGNGCIMQ